ncbi:homoserine kinase [Methylibium petroleiphilum]|uniref:Homoserine kinase n=1 Tax=Methylibium petroleiphilum (strain ATCC BAA-1232 / LMG 22953 / PM1) TaxID=420662 RepID=A2SEW8_METPP|nr:homoserine kinase [Methylibium petroleiphilum]ABM94107.1 homoserine kinase [Methylibium petroleiphilum PM1]
MAVFTEVGFDEAAALAHKVGLGPLKALKPIKAGIENTNYFLTAERGEYVLTLFERLSAEQLPFYLHLMKHLAGRDILVPMPQSDAHGEILHALCGKPAAIVERLRGGHVLAPSAAHCQQVGAMLARMHEAGRDYPYHQPNLRGLAWWDETVPQILTFLAPPQRALLEDELAFQHSVSASASDAALPRGPIHADLFRDNVMFDEDAEGRSQLTGFFDFYFAGVDRLAFDIAVCLNDWCIDLASGRLLEDRAAAFVTAYAEVRQLTGDELRLLPALLRAAALRFWISRLWDVHLPREASMLVPHDPTHFERVLRERIATPWHPASR